MIHISEDGKSFVEIKSFEDLLERPNFKRRIDANEHDLKQIIGQYSLEPKQPCGISSCGTKHNRGYLVTVSGGIETNIGNVCGKRIFGVEFTQHHRAFKKEFNAQRYREDIGATQNRLESIAARIQEISNGDHNADWCYKHMHAHITRLFPDDITAALLERARRSNPIVTRDIRLTEDEKEAGATGPGMNYRTETIFIIAGLTAVINYKNLRKIIDHHLGDELYTFKDLDSTSEDFNSLKRWHNWASKINSRIRRAENIIMECNRFLAPSNIELIRNYKTYL